VDEEDDVAGPSFVMGLALGVILVVMAAGVAFLAWVLIQLLRMLV